MPHEAHLAILGRVMRRCFQCGKRTDAEQLTAVGDGEFCAACFRLLLDARTDVAPAGAAPAVATEKPMPPASLARVARACLVCERSIQGDAAVSFLGGEICAACNAQMQRELHAGEAEDPAAPGSGSAARASEKGDTRAAGALGVARAAVTQRAPAPSGEVLAGDSASENAPLVFTPGAETRWCAGCERPMPGPGSYRVIAGEPYCPACVPFYSAMNLGARPRHPTPVAQPGGRAVGAGCDCCGAALELGAELREGFRLCTACLTSDAELALSVARARHRRKLEALRAAIEPGKKP